MEQRWLMGWWKAVESVGDVKVWGLAGRSREAVVRSVHCRRGARWPLGFRWARWKPPLLRCARVAESDVCAARVRGMRCNGLSLTRVLFVVAVDADVGRRGGLKEYLDPRNEDPFPPAE